MEFAPIAEVPPRLATYYFTLQRYKKEIIQTNNLPKNEKIQRNNSAIIKKIQGNIWLKSLRRQRGNLSISEAELLFGFEAEVEAGDVGGVVLGGVAAGLTVEAYHQGTDACQSDTVGVCQLLGYHVAELGQHGQHIAAFHATVTLNEARQLVGLYGAEVDGPCEIFSFVGRVFPLIPYESINNCHHVSLFNLTFYYCVCCSVKTATIAFTLPSRCFHEGYTEDILAIGMIALKLLSD